ncbi:UNVERIFIED_CONTAM: hypothetical protein Sangu_2984300 [Sesamum angustifolium]|uniref:Uncharacterized protein n=1 Tax=Sesamum angustifolium TaxID=2727405 RepID=A0AAW2IJT8_9LAMI
MSLSIPRKDGSCFGHHRKEITPLLPSYLVGVRTNTPLKQVVGKPEVSGRLVKWTIELSEYDISYLPRMTIKAQSLADFVSEMIGTNPGRGFQRGTLATYVDGSSTTQ